MWRYCWGCQTTLVCTVLFSGMKLIIFCPLLHVAYAYFSFSFVLCSCYRAQEKTRQKQKWKEFLFFSCWCRVHRRKQKQETYIYLFCLVIKKMDDHFYIKKIKIMQKQMLGSRLITWDNLILIKIVSHAYIMGRFGPWLVQPILGQFIPHYLSPRSDFNILLTINKNIKIGPSPLIKSPRLNYT